MKKIKAIIEKAQEGYWVYFENIPGCYSYGKTVNETINNSFEAVKEFIQSSKKFKKRLPNVLESEFEFEYKVDIRSFFNEFEALNISALAKKSDINASLLRQYASGKKNPSIDQTRKIEKGVHSLAKELAIIRF